MRYEMKMPDLATTDSDIRIVRWMIAPGEKIERGRPLVEVETDKAAMEVESVVGGVLLEVRRQVDDLVAVGDVIAVLEVDQPTAEDSSSAPARPTASAVPAVDSVPTPAVSAPVRSPDRPAAKGMFARNRAAADVAQPQPQRKQQHAQPQPPAIGRPLSVAERTAAKRLQASKQTVPHFYLQTSVNAAAMIARRKAAEPVKLVWDAFFVLAAARAVAGFERFRCRFDGERLVPIESDAIGVAVDVEGELFVIPIDARRLPRRSSGFPKKFAAASSGFARGDPEARRVRPAWMTVTNLGSSNVESFIPIINPPEAAILGVRRGDAHARGAGRRRARRRAACHRSP